MVLEGLPVDVKDELALLTLFQVEVHSGFDATNIVRKSDRESISNGAEGDTSFMVVDLIEGNVDGLGLGKVLGNQYVLLTFNKEFEGVGSDRKYLL